MSVSLDDLHRLLPDFLKKKRGLFEKTNTGKIYIPLLENQWKAIEALPVEVQPGTPLAGELAETDAEHDGFGGAVWHFTEAYLRCPGVSDDVRAAATRVRAQFIPALGHLQESYASEAKRAMDREKILDDFKEDLQMFPVIEEKGDKKKTLHDWVKAYLAAGRSLDLLLSQRADTDYDSRAGAGALRSNIVGQIRRMREALSDEVAGNSALPRALVDDVFKYYDQAAAEFTAKQRARKSKKPVPAAPEKKPEGAPAGG